MSLLIPILLYHSVDTQVAPAFKTWAVNPQQFDDQMRYLVENQYTPLTVTQLLDAMRGTLPPKPVVVTFDDGFLDFHTNALPILAKYQIPATMYIVTGFVGKTSRWLCNEGEGDRPIMTWAQLHEIQAQGIECGAHTHTHPQLDTLSLAQAKDEVERSKKILEDNLGQAVPSFAYPHGYFSRKVRHFVQAAAFTSACGVKHAISAAHDDPFALSRIIITDMTDMDAFTNYLAGTDLRVAPTKQSLKTWIWRWVRRLDVRIKGRPCID